jgi:hypothetical protein
MKIQSNSRQVPSIEQYTADKQFNDLLYGYIQEKSYIEVIGGVTYRYIDKMNTSELADLLGATRQTASKRFKHLIELGLLEEDTGVKSKKRYRVNTLDSHVASLIPFETLRKINIALSRYAISIYVYLMNRYIANGEQPFYPTMKQMKMFIGIADSTTSNNYIITDVLQILSLIGLVDWGYDQTEVDKTLIMVKSVSNSVREKC